ncbi:TonB-dependent receptor domain-containing protein [Paracoccus pacificus]|uniref:TonB-dependent receptor domain-containing protein n=1 Tax=Paracoccus pacificus TaxID=1463598 RepID=A0ABW4R622_9RHOB
MSPRPSVLLLLLTSAAAPHALFAQTAPSTIVLDPVVLRAGTEKVASQVPQSVTVVDEAELNQIAPDNIGQVLDRVPGVAGVGSGSFFGQAFNIRGFGAGLAASESGIVQMIDGEEKYYESYRQGSLFVEPDFLKRVEVLRGPGASTLYGSGALGGVIAMETLEAADLIPEGAAQGGRVRLGYDTNPDSAFGSAIWGWRNDSGFEAVAGFALRKLGDSTDSNGDVIVRADSTTPNLLLKAKQSFGDHYVEASYQHLEAKGRDQDFNQLEGAQVGLFPGFPGWGVGDITTRDQTARLVWGYDPADPRINMKVTLSYTNTIKDVRQGDDPAEPIMSSLLGRRDYGLWKLKAQNVADLSSGAFSHFLTFGAETLWQDRTSSVTSSSHPEAKTRGAGIFALSEIEMDRLTVNTGLRYERQRTEPADSVTYSDDVVKSSSFEPQIALMYRLSDDLSVFGSLARVNRMPTVDELYDGFRGAAPSPDLRTEKGRNVEIGLSWTHQSDAGEAAAKLTLFQNRITDMIVRTDGVAPTPAYVNLDRATLRGGELEASWRSDAWTLAAAVSVVNGAFDDDDMPDGISLPNDRAVLSAVWDGGGAWRAGITSTLAAGRDKQDGTYRGGYGVHDIFAEWTPQDGAMAGTTVHLGIDNVTNRDYTPATWMTGPAPGRNVKLTLTRKF